MLCEIKLLKMSICYLRRHKCPQALEKCKVCKKNMHITNRNELLYILIA
jgi:hypothetical protein